MHVPMGGEKGTKTIKISREFEGTRLSTQDLVVVEEPLELTIEYGPHAQRLRHTLAITMRTPGDDDALIRGFLLTEGIIDTPDEITNTARSASGNLEHHSITASLSPELLFDPSSQQRHFYTTSSCGICGKTSIEMVRQISAYRPLPGKPLCTHGCLNGMLDQLRQSQSVFEQTGGIHAAAAFDSNGQLVTLAEDVGRHNAMDKLIGRLSTQRELPFSDLFFMVSGRAGFELVQKAAVVGVSVFAAVGAPSSLAVELADDSEMTLVGFLKSESMNIYTHPERVLDSRG